MNDKQQKTYLRKKRKCFHPNLLFKKWLTEWKGDAQQNNSNMQHSFNRALKSLELYPLPLYSGTDCKILCHFGDKLCERIDTKLQRHIKEHGQINWDDYIKIAEQKKIKIRNNSIEKVTKISDGTTTKHRQRKRTYLPAFRSGAYALLVTLAESVDSLSNKGFMTKEELINKAQLISDTSFTITPSGSHYTAWSSMSTLIKKGLVFKCSSPARYSILEEGTKLVKQMKVGYVGSSTSDKELPASNSQSQVHSLSDNTEEISLIDDNSTSEDEHIYNAPKRKCMQLNMKKDHFQPEIPKISQSRPFIPSDSIADNETAFVSPNYQLSPGAFQIILCVDNAETAGGFKAGKKNMKDEILPELTRQKVNFNVRKLHVSDFLWIAQEISVNQKKRELVLPFIVERKRMDDLASSIVDGRFREQKYRLKQSGFNNPIYLVEEYGSRNASLPLSTCEQAITNTQIVDGFQIKLTTNIQDSVVYLSNMTNYIQRNFQDKLLRCLPKDRISENCSHWSSEIVDLMDFEIFNASSMKNKQLNVKDMFTKHLLQLSGLSIDKAAAIVEKYPTPRLLLAAFDNCHTATERNAILSTLRCSRSGRMIGPRISSSILQLYTSNTIA